jgi:hypothetical protein
MRTQYKFSHRSGDGLTYYWESVRLVPGDSRVEHIRCPVSYFWNGAYS